MRIYGHRGTRRGAPENTLAAMKLALAQHADGIELDVRLCQSGEVIVLHDPDLRRVAGANVVAAQSRFHELRAHDLGNGELVPLLDEALDLVLGNGALLNVELKSDVPDADALVAAVLDRWLARSSAERARVLFSSFSAYFCEELSGRDAEAQVALLYSDPPSALPAGIRAVNPHHRLLDQNTVAHWHAQGLKVNAWTVNDGPRALELAKAGVDGIITDDVPALRHYLMQTIESPS